MELLSRDQLYPDRAPTSPNATKRYIELEGEQLLAEAKATGRTTPTEDFSTIHNSFVLEKLGDISNFAPLNYIPGEDDVTFSKFLVNCSYSDYTNILVQVFFALQVAYEKCDYTNYDLQGDNIIISQLEQKVQIKFEFKNTTVYLTTDKLATVKDSSCAHVLDGKVHHGYYMYGRHGSLGVKHDSSYPFYDIYSLIIDTYVDMAYMLKEKVYAGIISRFTSAGPDDVLPGDFEYPRVEKGGENMDYLFVPRLLEGDVDFISSYKISGYELKEKSVNFIPTQKRTQNRIDVIKMMKKIAL